MGALVLSLAVLAAPQGVTVKVLPLELKGGATAAQALRVTTAVATELTGQGYGIVTGRARAQISGRLEKTEAGFAVRLLLTRGENGEALDDVLVEVDSAEALSRAGQSAAKSLATEIRLAFGVRARLKQ